MPSIFSKIISGEIPGTFVYQDDLCVAFLDIQPLTAGHTMVVPRQEIDHWLDLPTELNAHLFTVAQLIGQAQQAAFGCQRVGVMVQGYEVPHVHIHVWPTNSLKDFHVLERGSVASPETLEAAAAKIRAQLGEQAATGPGATA
ncbi:HIT family protein [Brevibacterium sp. 50QC2O2]|jgi:histidine triad (HIT) family protein|uniref:HIT family protein n=1 Tax=Brevibacterium TaxID=1696 RepID=UPI00211BB16F|nr:MULTISPECIES: HIT family protein [unclassified Brevibacterium]MCQ9366637.1 HIT family protein [Brevibacterium sp. 91QC2O2]MCQ9384481.1 HIT family protein [Brevibacterium sp. 68QC2CO]MCQ9389623.1 HIT family protein [Brevibacterium sp. 50QC2O2]